VVVVVVVVAFCKGTRVLGVRIAVVALVCAYTLYDEVLSMALGKSMARTKKEQ